MTKKRERSSTEDLELDDPDGPTLEEGGPKGDEEPLDGETELDLKMPEMTIPPSGDRPVLKAAASAEESAPSLELAREIGQPRGGTREVEASDDTPAPELAREHRAARGAAIPAPPEGSWKQTLTVIVAVLVLGGLVAAYTGVIEVPGFGSKEERLAVPGLDAPDEPSPKPTAPARAAARPDDMVSLPAATFPRGCVGEDPDCGEDEKPPEIVSMPALLVDRVEVTHEAYSACVAAGVCVPPGDRDPLCSARRSDVAGLPVSCVNALQADTYCHHVDKRLPSALEWEYAARSGLPVIFPWGDTKPTCKRANLGGCGGKSLPVTERVEGKSGAGALDLAGNVWEWTSDGSPARREIRGGSYLDTPKNARASNRAFADAKTQIPELGFRCVK